MVSKSVRLFHYVMAIVVIASLFAFIYKNYMGIRLINAGRPDNIYSSEMLPGDYVCFDYDYIVPTKVVAGYETYSLAKMKDRDEYVLVLFDGMAVFYLKTGDVAWTEDTLGSMLRQEGISDSATDPGTLYGVVRKSRDDLQDRFSKAFEVLGESKNPISVVRNENIDTSYVVSFLSKKYYTNSLILGLFVLLILIIVFIISCRLLSKKKMELEFNNGLKAVKEMKKAEVLKSAFYDAGHEMHPSEEEFLGRNND